MQILMFVENMHAIGLDSEGLLTSRIKHVLIAAQHRSFKLTT
jgi:hypothetical protein